MLNQNINSAANPYRCISFPQFFPTVVFWPSHKAAYTFTLPDKQNVEKDAFRFKQKTHTKSVSLSRMRMHWIFFLFLIRLPPPSVWLTCLRYFQEARQWKKKTEESPQNTNSLLPLMSNPEKCRYTHIHTLISRLLISKFPQLSKGFFKFPYIFLWGTFETKFQ